MIDLLEKLVALGAIRLGTFEMETDFVTPFSVDFARVISHADVAKEMARFMGDAASKLSHELVCGVPVVGACLATYASWERGDRLVALKESGVEKVVGMYKTGEKAVLFGGSDPFGGKTLEAVDALEDEGIKVQHVLELIDLGLGAKKKIKGRGVSYHSVIGMNEALDLLLDAGKVKGDAHKLATDFLEERIGR